MFFSPFRFLRLLLPSMINAPSKSVTLHRPSRFSKLSFCLISISEAIAVNRLSAFIFCSRVLSFIKRDPLISVIFNSSISSRLALERSSNCLTEVIFWRPSREARLGLEAILSVPVTWVRFDSALKFSISEGPLVPMVTFAAVVRLRSKASISA